MYNKWLTSKYWGSPNFSTHEYIDKYLAKTVPEQVLTHTGRSINYFLENNAKLNEILQTHSDNLNANLQIAAEQKLKNFVEDGQDQWINNELFDLVEQKCNEAIDQMNNKNNDQIAKIVRMSNIAVIFSGLSLGIVATASCLYFWRHK